MKDLKKYSDPFLSIAIKKSSYKCFDLKVEGRKKLKLFIRILPYLFRKKQEWP